MSSLLIPTPEADHDTRNGLIGGLAAALATILGLLLLLCCCLRRNRSRKDKELPVRKEDVENPPTTATRIADPTRQSTMDPIPEQPVEEDRPILVQNGAAEHPQDTTSPTPRKPSNWRNKRSPSSSSSSSSPDLPTSRKLSLVPDQGQKANPSLQNAQDGTKVKERVPTPPPRVATLPPPGRMATVPALGRAVEA